jgi:hypothetical protein
MMFVAQPDTGCSGGSRVLLDMNASGSSIFATN